MELSVLERQRAVLQRVYQDHLGMDSAVDHQPFLTPTIHPHPQINDQHSRSCSADYSILPIPKSDWQCNSSFPHKQANPNKRKAELDIEFETEDKQIDEEEAAAEEKSDITGENSSKGSLKDSEAQKQDYIHVRARRGQATDSHSLAERARREKISKKMKSLQDLVPGCNKVTGKAGMLDEIINYVQSLQKQVEFLSMKLATVNPRLDFSIDNFFAKEIPAYIAGLPAAAQLEATNSACFQYNPMQFGITNCTADVSMDQFHQILSQNAGTSSSPIPELFLDSSCISQLQQLSGWESDWQNIFSAGFP